MFDDLVQRRAVAEAGDVFVSVFVSLPRMKGADYSSRVFVGEGPEDSVHHVAQLAASMRSTSHIRSGKAPFLQAI